MTLFRILLGGWAVTVLWLGIAIHAATLPDDAAAAAWQPTTFTGWALPIGLLAVVVWLTWIWVRRAPHPTVDAGRRLFAPRSASARTAVRDGSRSRRKHGLASWWDVLRNGGRREARQKAAILRPSLAGQRRIPIRQVAVELCRVGAQTAYALIEDVVVVIGGARTGKTGWLGGRIIDAPGPCVVTSTRTDLYRMTRQKRARTGPVWVFDAAGIASQDDAAGFDPLVDCTDPEIPWQRAADMIPEKTGEREDWASLARAALAALMHAAALGGHSMATVRAWVADPGKHKNTILQQLRGGSGAYVEEARQFLECNDKTRSSITTSMMPALAWLNSAAAARAGQHGSGFSVDELLASNGTLYIVGTKDQSTALMAALVGYIARGARRAAAGERLDPNLTLALDEAALIAPPLPDWTADMGGAGVTILACVQSRADLIDRWGQKGAARIVNNARTIMLYGGTKDPDDLKAWTELFGNRDERVETTDEHGRVKSATDRQVPVLSAAQLANMPAGRCALLHRGMPPAIGRPRMVWRRWDVRLARCQDWLSAWRPDPRTDACPAPAPARRARRRSTTPDLAADPYLAPASDPTEPEPADAR